MQELQEIIKQVVADELSRASEQWGKCFNSAAEAYAVLKEEIEETDEELEAAQGLLQIFWFKIREGRSFTDQIDVLIKIKNYALNAAVEAIQVAAMAEKARRGYKR